jgi:Winged helix DNA-binding domain
MYIEQFDNPWHMLWFMAAVAIDGQHAAMLAERLTAQLLAGPPAPDPVAVAERLLSIQAQDLRGAQLAIRARTEGLAVSDVDRALTVDRSLLVTWLNRGTLHLVRREDYPWLQALTTPQVVTGNATRLAQEGVLPDAAERALRLVERLLTEEGPLTRGALRERLEGASVPTAGQAFIQIMLLSALRGLTLRGPMVGREQAFVLVRDWLGPLEPVDRDSALAELARRFLGGHGPAGDRDLARWAGLPLRDVRVGLSAIASELVVRPDGLVDLAGRPAPAPLPPPRLLGAFEPVLMGWTSRAPILAGHQQRLVTDNGIFRPFALVNGRAVGTWRLQAGVVSMEPFGRVAARDARALGQDAADVTRFLARP